MCVCVCVGEGASSRRVASRRVTAALLRRLLPPPTAPRRPVTTAAARLCRGAGAAGREKERGVRSSSDRRLGASAPALPVNPPVGGAWWAKQPSSRVAKSSEGKGSEPFFG